MDNETRIKKLEAQVKDLLAWKEQKIRQQLTFPLDQASKDALSRDFLQYVGPVVDVPPNPTGYIFRLNGKLWSVELVDPIIYE